MSFRMFVSIVAIAVLPSTSALAAKDPVLGCRAAKLKAAGKKAQQKLNCHATAVKKGVPVSSDCLAKADAAFAKAFAKAEKKTDCAGEPGTVEGEVDALVSAALTDVSAKRVFVSSATYTGDWEGSQAPTPSARISPPRLNCSGPTKPGSPPRPRAPRVA